MSQSYAEFVVKLSTETYAVLVRQRRPFIIQ